MIRNYDKLSNTRGASLASLTSLCYLLSQKGDLGVRHLANEAIDQGVFDVSFVEVGERLPTRIHHHMIALRMLDLVDELKDGGHKVYSLSSRGKMLVKSLIQPPFGVSTNEFLPSLQKAWRSVLTVSEYVQAHWLRYFVGRVGFDEEQLAKNGQPITLIRVPMEQREGIRDSGYRIISEFYDDHIVDTLDYREIYQGIRKWTDEVLLTDYRLPDIEPYVHQVADQSQFEIEVYVIRTWFDPAEDLERFEILMNDVLDTNNTDRISMPILIDGLCSKHACSKINVRQMLEELFYRGERRYFFERGSLFLVEKAFNIAHPEDYYVKIDGVWRTGISRKG